jgi:hypothetical protein
MYTHQCWIVHYIKKKEQKTKGPNYKTYLPKIILGIATNHPIFWQIPQPIILRLLIRLQSQLLITLKVSCIQSLRINPINLGQQLPRILNRLLFKIITKTPTSQHFKKRMMVRIPPHIVQIIMLPPRPDALLRIHGSFPPSHGRGGGHLTQKYRFELIHPRIGE